jgi:hypothetical protein
MEDFIEIIFYVIIFLISGLGSILKKRNDNKEESTPKPMFQTEDEINDTTAPIGTFDESELIRKLREIEITETKQHEEELISEQELKVKEEAEDIFRKQERIRRENELQGLMNKGQQARPCVWLGATYQPLLWKGAILVGAWISM